MNFELEALRELQLRRHARTDIYAYIEYMSRTGLLDFKFEPELHHKLIIDDLHKMIDGKWDQEAFSLPPGSAKSTYISVILPTFLLANDPTLKLLCISNSEMLSEDFARRRRAIMRSEEWQQISQTSLASDAQSLAAMGTNEGGSIYAVGCGSTITGLRADWVIMDDLVKGFEQANSMSQLDKIWSWLISEARSRLKPHGREILVATRWSAQDPIGRVLELTAEGKEKWKYIRIAMECDSKDDPLKRKIGQRLWPEWFTEKMVMDAKRDPAIWMCLYQQLPLTSTGEWCPREHIHIITERPQFMRFYIGCDIALSISDKSDWTVFAVFGLTPDRKLVLVDLYRYQRSVDQTATDLIEYCKKYNPVGVYIDDDNASKVWAKLVWEQARYAAQAIPLQIVPIKGRDKETRAAPLRSYLLQDQIQIMQAPWNGDLIDEMQKFPAVRHDDQIDGMSLVAAMLMKMSAPSAPNLPHTRPETQMGHVGGQIVINSTLDELFDQQSDKSCRIGRLRI
jgi:predicted phage terminase large subunit-like protein